MIVGRATELLCSIPDHDREVPGGSGGPGLAAREGPAVPDLRVPCRVQSSESKPNALQCFNLRNLDIRAANATICEPSFALV